MALRQRRMHECYALSPSTTADWTRHEPPPPNPGPDPSPRLDPKIQLVRPQKYNFKIQIATDSVVVLLPRTDSKKPTGLYFGGGKVEGWLAAGLDPPLSSVVSAQEKALVQPRQ